jgi:hypothetical protein
MKNSHLKAVKIHNIRLSGRFIWYKPPRSITKKPLHIGQNCRGKQSTKNIAKTDRCSEECGPIPKLFSLIPASV